MAVQDGELSVRVGRVAVQLRNKPDSVQVVDSPWYDASADDRAELFAVRINGAGLVVRAISMALAGDGQSLQAAIDESATRRLAPETVIGEWIDAHPDAGLKAARLVIGLARGARRRPDQSWCGQPIRATAPTSRYPPRVERWGHVVDYDSGRDEQWDFMVACESVEEAQALFQRYACE